MTESSAVCATGPCGGATGRWLRPERAGFREDFPDFLPDAFLLEDLFDALDLVDALLEDFSVLFFFAAQASETKRDRAAADARKSRRFKKYLRR